MKRWRLRLLALVLALAMMLSGCSLEVPASVRRLLAQYVPVKYEDMEYVRPDITELENALDAVLESAQQPDFDQLELDLYTYMYLYQDFYTNYCLADIRYCTDMTDIYWTGEYNYCLELCAQVDAGIDQLMYTLADSPHRATLETDEYYGEGYFDAYEGESIWDETFTALMDQESALLAEYYDLSAQGLELSDEEYYDIYAPQMCEIYVKLVALRQEIAAYAGYDSYPAFAYDFYYYRDYTPEQERAYLEQVRQELVPIYKKLYTYGVSGIRLYACTEEDTFAYVEQLAQALGGTVWESFELLRDCGLYDITYSENKYDASFEVFLSSYGEPFIFLNPTGSEYDNLTFAHEFGHFCNDYATYGGIASIDVAEVFSQGMEYLSLFYVDGNDSLAKYKMVDSLCVYVEQSAYADFEQRVYALIGDELTVENVFAVFQQVGTDYGFDIWGFDSRDFVGVPHFFTNPCYIFSYVVSNDAAIQLYQLEEKESGAGLALYEEQLYTVEYGLLSFLEGAGLESPFAEGRIQSVRDTFNEILGY